MKKFKKMTAEEKETLKAMINDECPCDTCLVTGWSCCGCPKETRYAKRRKIYMAKLNLTDADAVAADELTTIRMLYNTI